MTSAPFPAWLEPLGHGIFAIDTGFQRPRFDAAYLLVHAGRAAFIDTGTNHAVPRLLGALEALGLSREAVDFVIPTHVHLDHAGAAGLLMQQLPNAKLVVHPRGARHMIDPRVLLDGARAVYGADEVARTYGELQPVPAERVLESADGQVLELAGRPLLFIDSPGHAKHHHCIWDERSRGWFTGDTFGLSYPECEALKQSVARMLARDPVCMYLTHYSRVTEVPRLAEGLIEQVDAMVALALPLAAAPDRHARLMAGHGALYRDRLRALGSPLSDDQIASLLALDVELNAQGLEVWLDRQAQATESGAKAG